MSETAHVIHTQKRRHPMSTELSSDTLLRICGEFLEMPGLQLTERQAQRLWGLEPGVCHAMLEELVTLGFLCHRARDTYARTSDGPFALPQPAATAGRMLVS
jgi:hypothetical protein